MSLNSLERFQAVFSGAEIDRPPIWVMRQAGRYLPEYRKLKESYDFLTMVKTPELATEVTLQPLKRFNLDAAIIFSDILIIPEAMGQPYYFKDGGGIGMEFHIKSKEDIARLDNSSIQEKTAFLPNAIKLVKKEIGTNKAVLGFGGSPWTLATYMVEELGSASGFPTLKAMFFNEPNTFDVLMNKLSDSLIHLFNSQVDAGVDAIQIFDSWGAGATGSFYREMSLQWIEKIIAGLKKPVPVILFAKGMAHHAGDLVQTGASFLAADQSVDLPAFRKQLPEKVGIQGNLDPIFMTTQPELVQLVTKRLLSKMHPFKKYIFNLGHGITPNAKIECMDALVETVRTFKHPSEI